MRLIDIHAHHYPQSYLAACRRPDSGFEHYVRDDGRLVVLQDGAVSLAVPLPLPSPTDRVDLMSEAGIELQFVSVSAPNVYRFPNSYRAPLTRDINDELVDFARRSGGHIRALISLPLPDVDGALRELERIVDAPEVVGALLCSTIDRRTLDQPQFFPLFEELSRRRTPILVHPTVACCTEGIREYALALGFDFMAENSNAIARLMFSGMLERFSGIRWIFSHLGGTVPFIMHRFDNYFRQFPECREHIDRPPSEIMKALYFDTVTTHVPALRCALETFDFGQFVFGTDYPHVPGGLKLFVETMNTAVEAAAARAAIGFRTATEVFSIRFA